jgi:XTP/dITP diphosphohydrolase
MKRLLIASRNPAKVAELRALIAEQLPIEVLPLPEKAPEVGESGATFEENALLKARAAAAWAREWALADDSGLEVDALGGAPGVHSRRYAGEDATDAQRIDRLLAALSDVPFGRRAARFRCSIAIAAADGRTWTAEGICEGIILGEPRGEHGFGYDPVFFLPELGRTMAELAPSEKNRVSHRARALAAACELLRGLALEEEQ